MVWKSRGDFLLALDHCGVVIFCFYTAVFLSKSTMPFTRVMLGGEKQGSTLHAKQPSHKPHNTYLHTETPLSYWVATQHAELYILQ